MKQTVKLQHYRKGFFTYLVTKHLSTSSCLQTNSMNRGDVMLDKEGQRQTKKRFQHRERQKEHRARKS